MVSSRVVRVGTDDGDVVATLREGVARLQAELGVSPEFPPEVEAAAVAAASSPRLPELDRTDLPLVTIDPPSARDLDQALHIAADGDGFVVHYAIADLAAFVTPGDAVDRESHRRGQTLYGADTKVPLHPPVLSEDAASLLPGQVRPALLWTMRLDAEGEELDARVERARVRSTAQLSYAEAQAAIDDGSASESLQLLREVGSRRVALEIARGGVSLPLPDQEVVVGEGRWSLEFRSLLPVEEWNAQISLMTGMAAASMMVYARVGLLRTLPLPDPQEVLRLHRVARAMAVDWPAELLYPDFIRSLDPSVPAHAAVLTSATRLLRGSGYVAFDGEVPAEPEHSAIAAEYAHVTAPLRRLADRYALEVCVALSAGDPVPGWVLAALPDLPHEMRTTGQLASAYERGVVDLVEAGALSARVGEVFDAVVVAVDKSGAVGTAQVPSVAVEARVEAEPGAELPLGHDVQVRLVEADVDARRVVFRLI